MTKTLAEMTLKMVDTDAFHEFEFEGDGAPPYVLKMFGEFLSHYPKVLSGKTKIDKIEARTELAVISTFCDTVAGYKILGNNLALDNAIDKVKLALADIKNEIEEEEREENER